MTNPIIGRELLGVLRSRRALVLQVGLGAVLAMLVILRWPTQGQVDQAGQLPRQVLSVFGYGLMALVLMLCPAYPATSIVRERLSGTLELLLNSPMGRWSILLGKLAGVMGFVILLLILSLPAAAACYAMGQIDLVAQLGTLYLLLLLATLQYSSLALLISSHADSPDSALRLTYGAVLILAVATVGVHQLAQGLVDESLLNWIRAVSPIPSLMDLLGHGGVGAHGLVSRIELAGRHLGLALVVIGGCLALTAARLDRRQLDRPRAVAAMTDDRTLGMRIFRRLLYVVDPKRRSRSIGPFTNPVMVKEFRTRRFGRAHWLLRLVFLCLLASFLMAYATMQDMVNWGMANTASVLVILQMALIVLITPSLASGLISAEMETGNWQLLQLTPLSPLRIITGKLMSVMWTMVLILMATLPAYGVLIGISPAQTARLRAVIVTLVLTALFTLMISAAVSSLFRRTANATAVAYTVVTALSAGTLLIWLGQDTTFTRGAVQAVLTVNPVAVALSIVETRGFEHYQLVPAGWWFMGAACVACLALLVVRTWRLTRPQ